MQGLPAQRKFRGFTIVELMIVVAIVAVILSLAAPSFKRMIETQRLRGVHDQIVTDLQFARSEAARRGFPVHLIVRSQAGGVGACYTVAEYRGSGYGSNCNCTLAPGSRCVAPSTEIKTVQLATAHNIQLQSAGGGGDRVGFDPVTGGVLATVGDEGGAAPPPFQVESYMLTDFARKIRTVVEYTGRPSTCAPPGSSIRITPC